MDLLDPRFLAVIAATVAGGAIGALWYSNAGLLPAWTRANGAPPRTSGTAYAVMFLAGLGGATAVALLAGPDATLGVTLPTGLLCGVPVAALSVSMNHAFRPGGLSLALIDGLFHVVRFAIYGVVLGLWPP